MRIFGWLYPVKRWMYPDNRPNWMARALNRLSALQYAAGLSHTTWVTLEVAGRRSGRIVQVPVVVAEIDGERYLVSMLGEDVNWVRNVRAAGGRAVIRRGQPQPVRLEEVAPGHRGPILRRYLAAAPGARPHIDVDRHAADAELEAAARSHPVFRIVPEP